MAWEFVTRPSTNERREGRSSPLASVLIASAVVAIAPSSGAAKDFGVHGPIFEIEERSVLEVFMEAMRAKEASGEIDALREEMQAKTRAAIERPTPVEGVAIAEEPYEYLVDLSVTVERDLADHNGQVFARAGTVINPLDYQYFEKTIIMIDGDDLRQVAFAARTGDETNTYIVMVNGNPVDTSNQHGRRFWFDVSGEMARKFELRHVPAIIQEDYPYMRVTVVPPHQLRGFMQDG